MGSISVDSIFENLCNILKARGKVQSISQSFSELTSDKDRVRVVHNLLADLQLLPSLLKFKSHHKNPSESSLLKNEGNKSFKMKDDLAALKLYTQSIMYAPVPNLNQDSYSDNLSLAFANRSAVLFAKERYNECMKDINFALEYNYPSKLKYKLLERKGKCCLHFGKYEAAQKCFLQAQEYLSVAEGLSEEKKQQIEKELKDLCNKTTQKGLLDDHSPDPITELPEKSFDQHPQIPCASNALTICYNSDMGRYVEAAVDIQPGDVLLVEKPFASVLLPEFHSSHCSFCLRHNWAPLPCLHCSMVVYCSAQCRALAWETSHRIECSLLSALVQLDCGKFSLLALRIILKASYCGDRLPNFLQQLESFAKEEASTDKSTLGFDASGMYYSDSYCPIYHLVGNTETRTVGDLFRRSVTAACMLDCLQKMSSFFDAHGDGEDLTTSAIGGALLRHLQNLPCNAHEVTEYVRTQSGEGHHVAESVEIGAAAYATLSLLNHGCDPGVVRHSAAGDYVVLRALRPLKCGEQVLDNYGQHYALHKLQVRQSHLQTQYHFSCNCQPCLQDWPSYTNLPSSSPNYLCLKCRSKLPFRENTAFISCGVCGETTDVLLLQQQLLTSSKQFLKLLTMLLEGKELVDGSQLVEHLQLLDNRVERPWKEYSDCQETLKQYFNLLGNYYCR